MVNGGACMAKGDVHGKEGACMAKGGGMHGEGSMHGKVGGAWQKGASMTKGSVHGRGEGGMRGRRDSHCSRRYASYWNAFLVFLVFVFIFMQFSAKFSLPVC